MKYTEAEFGGKKRKFSPVSFATLEYMAENDTIEKLNDMPETGLTAEAIQDIAVIVRDSLQEEFELQDIKQKLNLENFESIIEAIFQVSGLKKNLNPENQGS